MRNARVLTKNPISGSTSVLFRPAIGDPTTMSLCPEYAPSSVCSPASMVMNSVTPSLWLSDVSFAKSSRDK